MTSNRRGGCGRDIRTSAIGMSTRPRRLPTGPWSGLLRHAFRLIDEMRIHGTADPFWTLGGGTVLMLRYQHRRSKDIDIFVPDPDRKSVV